MSAHNRLIVQPKARADVKEILTYTRKRWGLEQRRQYADLLRRAMRSLVDRPEQGRARDEYFPGCRGLVVERHMIFFHLDGDDIIVDRVLHQNQDAASKLSQ